MRPTLRRTRHVHETSACTRRRAQVARSSDHVRTSVAVHDQLTSPADSRARHRAAGDGSAKRNVMNNLPYTHVIRFAENNRFFFVDSEIVFRSVGGRAIKIAEKTRGRDRGNLDGKMAVRRVRAAPSVLDIFYIVYLKVFFSLRTR